MQVAYVAYQRLKDGPEDKADQLLRLNPSYQKWTAGAPPAPPHRDVRPRRVVEAMAGVMMRPKQRRESGQNDLFRSRLDQILNLDHALVWQRGARADTAGSLAVRTWYADLDVLQKGGAR